MANFSKTITNSVRLFGQGPSSKWSAHNWNAFRWGEGTVDIRTDVVHYTGTALNAASSVQKSVFHYLDTQLQVLDSSVLKSASRTINMGAITVGGDLFSETLRDGSGYQYNFPDRTAEGESRTFVTWTQAVDGSAAWTMTTAPSTTWSEA